jgi:hypothetical protein
MPGFRAARAALVALAGAALLACGAAAAATAAAGQDFASELKPTVTSVFAKRAPKLALRSFTCSVAKNGASASCRASFAAAAAHVEVAYAIAATLPQAGGIKWRTTSRACTSTAGKQASCPSAATASAGSTLTPAQVFANQLQVKIEPVFHKQVPGLLLATVTCVLPTNGNVVQCQAHFSDPSAGANVVYGIKATLKDSGVLTWTTTTHSCTNAKTGKKLAC